MYEPLLNMFSDLVDKVLVWAQSFQDPGGIRYDKGKTICLQTSKEAVCG